MLDGYLQQLTEEDVDLHSQGSWTLDSRRARAQLAAHQLANLQDVLLAVVRAASLAGCSWLLIASTRETLRRLPRLTLWISDWELTREQLDKLPAWGLDPAQPRELQEFAAALNSLYPRLVHGLELTTWSQGTWNTAACSESGWRGNEPDKPADWPEGATLRLRLDLPRAGLQNLLRRRSDDAKIVAGRTRWCEQPQVLLLKSESVHSRSAPWPLPAGCLALGALLSDRVPLRDFADVPANLTTWKRDTRTRTSFRCALFDGPAERSNLLVVHAGITVARWDFVAEHLQVSGVVHTQDLDLDLSRREVVSNARWEALCSRLRFWINLTVAAWVRSLASRPLQRARRLQLTRWLQLLTTGRRHRPLLEALEQLPLVPLCGGEWITIAWLRPLVQRFGGIHAGSSHLGVNWAHDRPIVSTDSGVVKALCRLYGWKRVRAKRALRGPQHTLEQLAEGSVAHVYLQTADWRAVVHVPASFGEHTLLQINRSGVPLQAVSVRLWPDFACGFRIRLDGDFDHSFDAAPRHFLTGLRQQLPLHAEALIRALLQAAGDFVHPQAFYAAVRLLRHGAPCETTEQWQSLPDWVLQARLARRADGETVTLAQLIDVNWVMFSDDARWPPEAYRWMRAMLRLLGYTSSQTEQEMDADVLARTARGRRQVIATLPFRSAE